MKQETEWLFSLREKVDGFMEHQKSRQVPGYYRFSYSGDLFDENRHWNIGSSVYALKIYYTLDRKKDRDIKDACAYIRSFLHKDSRIYDDFVYRNALVRNLLVSLLYRNWANLSNEQYKNAETRQSYSALMLYDELPGHIHLEIPSDEGQISKYLDRLNWKKPWGAGSHFSHLMFFYRLLLKSGTLQKDDFDTRVDYAIKWVNRLRDTDTGGWYMGQPTQMDIINGAMKIITGLNSVDRPDFEYPEALVDTCLSATNERHACDNFNVIFVLNYASKMLDRKYRQAEIEDFALDRLNSYKAHFNENQGGFSFFPHATEKSYYHARQG